MSNPNRPLAATPEQMQARREKKAKIASVMQRGFVAHKTSPENVRNIVGENNFGEWARNDPDEISRIRALGGDVFMANENTPAAMRSPDGKVVVGDSVLVVFDAETMSLMKEVQLEEFNRAHGIKSEQLEERTFMAAGTGFDDSITPFTGSKTSIVGEHEITAAIEAVKSSQ